MRKGPLEVRSLGGRMLLHKEPAFFLFATDGAAKEQWYLALCQAIDAAGVGAGVQQLYNKYCALLRQRLPGVYPQVWLRWCQPFSCTRKVGCARVVDSRDAPSHRGGGRPGGGPMLLAIVEAVVLRRL